MSGKLLFSVFNTMFKSYSSKLIAVNSYRTFQNYPIPFAINKGVKFSTQQNATATYEEVKDIGAGKRKNVWLIDVREPEELTETGTLPGSINIPLDDLESVIKTMSNEEFLAKYGRERPNQNCNIVFSCKSGKRSATAQSILQQMGYKNVKNYLGGWLEWEEKSQFK